MIIEFLFIEGAFICIDPIFLNLMLSFKNQDGLITLLPKVVDLVRDRNIPVIAAGGIVDERGYVAALALGAQGVALGTRFDLPFVYKSILR